MLGCAGNIEELRDRREGKGRLWFFGYLMQLEEEGGVIERQSFKKRNVEIWWDLNLQPSDNWLGTLPLNHIDRWNFFYTYIWWIAIQLRIFLSKQLKLNGELAKDNDDICLPLCHFIYYIPHSSNITHKFTPKNCSNIVYLFSYFKLFSSIRFIYILG